MRLSVGQLPFRGVSLASVSDVTRVIKLSQATISNANTITRSVLSITHNPLPWSTAHSMAWWHQSPAPHLSDPGSNPTSCEISAWSTLVCKYFIRRRWR